MTCIHEILIGINMYFMLMRFPYNYSEFPLSYHIMNIQSLMYNICSFENIMCIANSIKKKFLKINFESSISILI